MKTTTAILDWINTLHPSLVEHLQAWSDINTGSDNLDGLSRMLQELTRYCERLHGKMRLVTLPSRTLVDKNGNLAEAPHGLALHIVKRPEAATRIFLGGHMDTVYSPSHQFQKAERIDSNIMRGPGVTDMKGGLLVMLTALEAFEKSPHAHRMGWEIVINPDEEIGSIGSEKLLVECASRNTLGLLFEPSFSDGALVGARKGSANITVVARGKAAHAGRDFDKGRNAITALAQYALEADKLSDHQKGISVNIGQIAGGGPSNIVPDLAICHLNVRATDIKEFESTKNKLVTLAKQSQSNGITLQAHLETTRDPKSFDDKNLELFEHLNDCAKQEGYTLSHRPSGGVCDGNLLWSNGLPVIDTLGVVGGEIHTPEEFVYLDSLTMRARLVTLFLIKLAERSK